MKKLISILFFSSILFSIDFIDRCGFHHQQTRNIRPNCDLFIDSPSGHFRVHYNATGNHSATQSYALAVGEAADYSRNILVNIMGFLPEIDDEDGIYDIYLQSHADGNYGYNAGDCDYPAVGDNYSCSGNQVAGASFIVIDNDFNYSCSDIPGYANLCVYENSGIDVMKVVIAHEFFHAIQRRYIMDASPNKSMEAYFKDRYFFELMSTWFEDVAYPEINDYLNFAWPYLQTPELNISCYFDACNGVSTDDGYSLALFGHYLAKVYDEVDNEQNSTIIKKILEQITGDYQGEVRDEIDDVLITYYGSTFAEAWSDFNARNVFNSKFDDSYNQIYYYDDQKYINPILCSDNDCGSWWNADMNISPLSYPITSDLYNQEGAVSIKSYQVEDISFLDFIFNMHNPNQIINEDFAGYVAIESLDLLRHRIYNLKYFSNYICSENQYNNQVDCEDNSGEWEPTNGDILALDSIDKIHILGAFNGYEYTNWENMFNLGFNIGYSAQDNYFAGDINLDNSINIVDITSSIDFILENTNISDFQYNLIDINNDSNVNIVDVMNLVNIILNP